MTSVHPVPAVVIGLRVNGLGVVRVLARHGVPVIGVAVGEHGSGRFSRHLSQVWTAAEGAEDLIDLLLRQAGRFSQPPVLYPTMDTQVLELVKRREEWHRWYRFACPPAERVEKAMSKHGFARLAEQFGLPVPRTVLVDEPGQMGDVAKKVSYPCILKPEFRTEQFVRLAAAKAFRADCPEELLAAYRRFCRAQPRVIVQEWISGGDGEVYFCLQYYDRHSRPAVSFCGRKIRQWPPLCGSTASCEPVDCPELVRLASRFFTAIGFTGLCSMEFKRDPNTGRFLMIEPTIGRADWQSGLADINGVPIAYLAYCEQVGLPLPAIRPARRRTRWVRWGSDKPSAAHYIRAGRLSLPGWLWSIRPPMKWAVWSAEDPRPYLSELSAAIRRRQRQLADWLLRRRPASG